MIMYSKLKSNTFLTEVTLNLEVKFTYREHNGEIEIESTSTTIGNSSKDIYLSLPTKVIDKIEAEIMEAIAYEKKHP